MRSVPSVHGVAFQGFVLVILVTTPNTTHREIPAWSHRDHVAIALFATDFSRWSSGPYLDFLSRLQPGFSAIRKPG